MSFLQIENLTKSYATQNGVNTILQNLNLEIEKAKNEFDDRNYERALEILDSLEVEGEYHKLAVMIRIASLMALKRYDDSLSVIDSNIEKFPYSDFLWSRRVECHYFNGDEENAVKSLEELERIVNKDEKHALVFLAEEFELLDNHEKALKYCDMALGIDEDFEDAVLKSETDKSAMAEVGEEYGFPVYSVVDVYDIIEYLEEDEKNRENVERIKNYLLVNGAKE